MGDADADDEAEFPPTRTSHNLMVQSGCPVATTPSVWYEVSRQVTTLDPLSVSTLF